MKVYTVLVVVRHSSKNYSPPEVTVWKDVPSAVDHAESLVELTVERRDIYYQLLDNGYYMVEGQAPQDFYVEIEEKEVG